MVDIRARVAILEMEVRSLQEDIGHINAHIALLVASLQTLWRVVSNLQDMAFDGVDDDLDSEFGGAAAAEQNAEDSDRNPNALDNRSDATNDDSDVANSGDGGKDCWGNEVDDTAFDVFNHADSD